jgi:hypothetical protein
MARLNKFSSKNVLNKLHNKLHGLTLCAITVCLLPNLCTPHIQLSVRSLSRAVTQLENGCLAMAINKQLDRA